MDTIIVQNSGSLFHMFSHTRPGTIQSHSLGETAAIDPSFSGGFVSSTIGNNTFSPISFSIGKYTPKVINGEWVIRSHLADQHKFSIWHPMSSPQPKENHMTMDKIKPIDLEIEIDILGRNSAF